MAYYSSEEMKKLLDDNPEARDKLYCRGFLITDNTSLSLKEYPFYSNWNKTSIGSFSDKEIVLFTHNLTTSYTYSEDGKVFFLVGHAYNPFSGEYEETEILKTLSQAYLDGEKHFWSKESELTGVFCIGFMDNQKLVYSTDAAGMQMIYYGDDNCFFYITSHSKLVADLCGLNQDEYITRLVNSKFYHYWGTFLPGDLSPYRELKRTVPNHKVQYNFGTKDYSINRYFPYRKITEISDTEYETALKSIIEILEQSLSLIVKKWPDKKAAISLTGGRDSTTTLASAHNVYDQLSYFSYISNKAEEADAKAAQMICKHLGLQHRTYRIPEHSKLYSDINIYKKILECNAGCIGPNNENDVRKRVYLNSAFEYEMEIKSWVGELSRAEAQNKYNTTRFPKRPNKGYYRCMWKVILNPRLIRESNKIFNQYLYRYYDKKTLSYLPWTDFFFWEFSWSAGEGQFLTSEQKFSNDISVPYNNRKLLTMMLSIPFKYRLKSKIQTDTIHLLDRRIEDTSIHVSNIAHTDFWKTMIRIYVRVFSKL